MRADLKIARLKLATLKLAIIITSFLPLLVAWAVPVAACGSPPPYFDQPVEQLLSALKADAAPALQAVNAYALDMEACYDGPTGPLQLRPHVETAAAFGDKIKALQEAAEAQVRGNEFDHEALLASDLWGDLESLRVAAHYAHAWGQLALAAKQVSAEARHLALPPARDGFARLGFEFGHPLLVQRAMYGLAIAHIESGDVAAAKATLTRLLTSLKKAGQPAFAATVKAFHADIHRPDYRPPVPLADTANQGEDNMAAATGSGASSETLARARRALVETRKAIAQGLPAGIVAGLLQPAFAGDAASVRQAFALAATDASLRAAADYSPLRPLALLETAFARGQYANVREGWEALRPWKALMPKSAQAQLDYYIGASLINLNDPSGALPFLQAARRGYPAGEAGSLLDGLVDLAQLSAQELPADKLLKLAQKYQTLPDLPPDGADLPYLLAMRARVVLAQAAAAKQDWSRADALLTGFGPSLPVYRLFTGMRIRLLAEAVKADNQAGVSLQAVNKKARGGHLLYQLWRVGSCHDDCLRGDDVAVHRAALELALYGGLETPAFGTAWAAFAVAGGDVRPLLPDALRYLVMAQDGERLATLLEPANENDAAFALGHWKKLLAAEAGAHEPFLSNGLSDLQGRPQAVLLEALIQHYLNADDTQAALAKADRLARDFPRRPGAWFLRAAALQQAGRQMEAARALSSLMKRTAADEPVGMGARLGLAASFVALDKRDTACAVHRKIFIRPQAAELWAQTGDAFPYVRDWASVLQDNCAQINGGNGAYRSAP